jgi:hypothetical protein
MSQLPISEAFYVEDDGDGRFCSGEAYHIERNRHGGSVATPIARYFISRPKIGAEGLHPHLRLDCFVRRHELSPSPEWLARRLADVLIAHGALAEPAWVSWHVSEEIDGESRGEVFDLD